ncbi:Glutathione S-transferase [Trichinella pseudospiralis]
MRHLARQFDLYGTSEDMSYVDEVFESISNLQKKYKRFIIDDQSERSRNFFLQNILPLELGTFEALLMDLIRGLHYV